jgi:hypothetical protein
MSHPNRTDFRSRRDFLIRTAASMAGGSLLVGMTPKVLLALHPAVSARETALGFLASLSEDQRSAAQISYADGRRSQWHFIPMESRKGLPLREMNDSQRQAAMGVLATILSESGFQRAVDIMAYESILLELEGPAQAKRRDYQKFYFAIYGNPDAKDLWGVSVEGHHLSINMTFLGDQIVDSTPQFFGVNPAKLLRDFETPDPLQSQMRSHYAKGNRLLVPEEGAGFELLQSLNDEQRAQAIYSTECPEDIQWPGQPQPVVATMVGIAAAELTADQQRKLAAIINAYFSTMPDPVAKDRWQLLIQSGLDKIHFGWAGGTETSDQHFMRVQGPSFIAELCNFQTDPQGNRANHIHSVWRDLTGDFHLPIQS